MTSHFGIKEKEDILVRLWIINERGFDIRPRYGQYETSYEKIILDDGKNFNKTIYGMMEMLDIPQGCGEVRKILKILITEGILMMSGMGVKAESYRLDGNKIRKKIDVSYPNRIFMEYNDYFF